MVRTIGAGLIGLAGTGLGLSLARQLKARCRIVCDFRDALFCMQQKITFYKTPLPQMMREVAEGTGGSVSSFFFDAALRLEENRDRTAEAVLKRCFRDAEYVGLPHEARLSFERLLSSLGWMDGANQAEAIGRAVREFDELERRMRLEFERRGKCYLTIGVCCGFAAAIIVI